MIHQVWRSPVPSPKTTSIFVFGDRQQGSPGYRREMWQEFEHQFRTTPNSFALGVGDYGDFLRHSMKERLKDALSKDASARAQLDKIVEDDHNKIICEMEFLKGKLLGLHQGHHCWDFAWGINTDQRLAAALKAPYLGFTATTRVVIAVSSSRPGKEHGLVYTMYSTHGNANGRRVAAAVNWMDSNLVHGFGGNQFIMGHGCKNANFTPNAIDVIRRSGPPGLDRQVPRCLIVGGFADGYTNGWESSYVERAGFAPQPLGWGLIRLSVGQRKAEHLAKGLPNTRRPCNSLNVEQLNVVPEQGAA